VQKTQTKRVISLAGDFQARRIVLECDRCGRVEQDPALRQWVAQRCNTAWDVMVFVGRRLFQDCHSVGRVRAELLARDVPLSDSQIGKLACKFILYLALAHFIFCATRAKIFSNRPIDSFAAVCAGMRSVPGSANWLVKRGRCWPNRPTSGR
jgi:hypothetical protein